MKALLELGYDPLLVLPKLKKQYTERDLDLVVEKAVEPLRLENTALKERIQELEQSKDTQIVNLIQEDITQTEEPEVEDSELEVLLSVIEPVEIVSTAPEIDNSKTLPQIETLKDLKGYRAIALFEGEWKSGSLGNQNGTKQTIQFKKAENGKIYTFDFSQIQVEYGDRFHDLNALIEEYDLTVEERNAEQLRLEIEERKAQREVKASKGFGFSSKNQSPSPHKSLNSKGFAASMSKKMGAR